MCEPADMLLADDDAIRQVRLYAVSALAGNAFILTARDDTFLPYAELPGVTTFHAHVLRQDFPVFLQSITSMCAL